MFKRLLRAAALPAVVLACLTAAAVPGQAATVPGWRIVAMLPDDASFDALTATGPANAWTAGTDCGDSSCSGTTLLVRHWDGKAWRVIAVPKAFVNKPDLAGASAVAAAASSAWIMVGEEQTTEVLHWTGKGWGKTVTLPADISAAVAPTATDVWAFGGTGPSSAPYAAHYNGTTWTAVRVPVTGSAAYAASAGDIWVFGSPRNSNPSLSDHLAIMAFNGKAWRSTPLPGFPNEPIVPVSIAAVNATDVWASAEILVPGASVPPILLHWNGKTWAEITVPYNGSGGALALDGRGGIWLAATENAYPLRGYLLHYAGGKWSRVTAPATREEIDFPNVLAWIPGTGSLWGTGGEIPTSDSGPSPGVIFKDGP